MNKLTKYLFEKEWFLKSRADDGFWFWFFKYLLDTYFQQQKIAWYLLGFRKYKFYRNCLEPKIYKHFEQYRYEIKDVDFTEESKYYEK